MRLVSTWSESACGRCNKLLDYRSMSTLCELHANISLFFAPDLKFKVLRYQQKDLTEQSQHSPVLCVPHGMCSCWICCFKILGYCTRK